MDSQASGAMATSSDGRNEINRLNNEAFNEEQQQEINIMEVDELTRNRKIENDQTNNSYNKQFNVLIQQFRMLCSKKKYDGSPGKKNHPSFIGNENNSNKFCKCGSLKKHCKKKSSGDHTKYILRSKKDRKGLNEEDPDKLFFLSILPYVKSIPECNKLEWQIECLKLFQRYGINNNSNNNNNNNNNMNNRNNYYNSSGSSSNNNNNNNEELIINNNNY
ncbi:probable serine/threonine-protein kinase samkB [Halyomorpha halys]|uniref:probable serine/threonine-protein kinase samkB n=1 Tax=Halyomorpha halys TaxID=286706 RepID=UPI0034D2DA1C